MSKPSLKRQACRALLDGARKANFHVAYSEKGYAPSWKQNLYSELPLQEIEQDLRGGAGQELRGKLQAAHSSSALAINVFGPWRRDCSSFQFQGVDHPQGLQFEAQCATGLGGTPPHLDVLIESSTPVAVESKCTEWMSPKRATFVPAYEFLLDSHGHTSWFELVGELRSEPTRFRFLDAAQLIKHALGLTTRYPRRSVRLLYLYWEPLNNSQWKECQLHRNEIERLQLLTRGSDVELHAASYTEVLLGLEAAMQRAHSHYLQTRYGLAV